MGPIKAGDAIQLVNKDEQLCIKTEAAFLEALGCLRDGDKARVKVLSVFGPTGEGKSHALNHLLFGGREVFRTSSSVGDSCTSGVYAAYEPNLGILALDTEGMLAASQEIYSMRLLLKVLALSDMAIYVARSNRMNSVMIDFLAEASRQYLEHFAVEVARVAERCGVDGVSAGPAVCIFNEPRDTHPYSQAEWRAYLSQHMSGMEPAENPKPPAFYSLSYVGVPNGAQTGGTNWDPLRAWVIGSLKEMEIRGPRPLKVVVRTLHALTERFSGRAPSEMDTVSCLPDELFTCKERCLACNRRCCHTANHDLRDRTSHDCQESCVEKHEFQNFDLICVPCERGGRPGQKLNWQISESNSWSVSDIAHGLANAAIRGSVLYCDTCGPIHTSRSWGLFSNESPEGACARRVVNHVWRDHAQELSLETSNSGRHGARRIIDGAQSLVESVAPYTTLAKDMLIDQVAPSYWQPSASATECHCCSASFNKDKGKHHCRACGYVVCDGCSPYRVNAGGTEVRICGDCHEQFNKGYGAGPAEALHRHMEDHGTTLTIWKATQNVSGAVSYVSGGAAGLVKEQVRPEYWRPDSEITNCSVCASLFDTELHMHHCRACGEGVCDRCSQKRCRLPHHGWRGEERVCDTCFSANLACREGLYSLGDDEWS